MLDSYIAVKTEWRFQTDWYSPSYVILYLDAPLHTFHSLHFSFRVKCVNNMPLACCLFHMYHQDCNSKGVQGQQV